MRTKLATLLAVALVCMTPGVTFAQDPVRLAQANTAPIDINRAKAEELMTLKGIGEVRATAIIKGRPYARKDELVQKKIIPESVYNDIKDRIVAKQ